MFCTRLTSGMLLFLVLMRDESCYQRVLPIPGHGTEHFPCCPSLPLMAALCGIAVIVPVFQVKKPRG